LAISIRCGAAVRQRSDRPTTRSSDSSSLSAPCYSERPRWRSFWMPAIRCSRAARPSIQCFHATAGDRGDRDVRRCRDCSREASHHSLRAGLRGHRLDGALPGARHSSKKAPTSAHCSHRCGGASTRSGASTPPRFNRARRSSRTDPLLRPLHRASWLPSRPLRPTVRRASRRPPSRSARGRRPLRPPPPALPARARRVP
jgi:hypothetical protein